MPVCFPKLSSIASVAQFAPILFLVGLLLIKPNSPWSRIHPSSVGTR